MSTECSLKMGRSNPGTGGYAQHWHNSVEMIYGYSNEYTVTAGRQTLRLSDNDIIFIPPRILHSFEMKDQPSRLYFLQFKVLPMRIGGDIDRNKKDIDTYDPMTDRIILINRSKDPKLHPLMVKNAEDLIDIMINCRTAYRYMAVSKLYGMLSLLAEFPTAAFNSEEKLSDDEVEIFTKTLNFIEKNYSDHITVDDAAKYCGFNKKYFGRIFNKITDSYFNDFLNDYRIKKAAELLGNKRGPISDIAYSCGFTSIPTFYRCFSKTYGCSPKQFISKYKV